MRQYWVYILASRSKVLYVGVTGNLPRRLDQHKKWLVPGFTSLYRLNQLVHCEGYPNPRSALEREKQIKGWRRSKKLILIEAANPEWNDLSAQDGWADGMRWG